MPGIIKDAWDWATTSPEFVKKRVKQAHESVEPRSVFDEPYEKYTKPAIHAAIDTADTFATPADVAGLLAGGAGFAGAEIANRLRRLPRVSNMEHYIDAIRLGKTPTEATKIAASGGRRAADKARIAEEIEAQFKLRSPKPTRPPAFESMPRRDPNFNQGIGNAEMAGSAGYPRATGGPVRQAAGKGKSGLIDLAEAVRRNARKPYFGR